MSLAKMETRMRTLFLDMVRPNMVKESVGKTKLRVPGDRLLRKKPKPRR
jgi:hypothetical protein